MTSVTREQLYAEVWGEPMTTVAKRYDVSSNYLARVCERMGVPRPPRGYWAKLRHGAKLKRPTLPEPGPCDELEWARQGQQHVPHLRRPRKPKTWKASAKRRRTKERPAVHPLVVGAREHFEKHRKSYWSEYLRPYKRNVVDLWVTEDTLARALELTSELFLTLEDRGQRVEFAPTHVTFRRVDVEERENAQGVEFGRDKWSPGRATVTWIGELAVGLTVFEVSEEVEVYYDSKRSKYVRVASPPRRSRSRDWTHTRWMPTGRLGIHAYSPYPGVKWGRYWREAEDGDFPDAFKRVARQLAADARELASLVEKADREHQDRQRKWEAERAEWERREVIRREHEVREEEARRLRERKEQREGELIAAVDGWRRARDIRTYVHDVRTTVTDAELEIAKGGSLDEQLKWALDHADRIDPLTRLREDIARVKAGQVANCVKCEDHPAIPDGTAECGGASRGGDPTVAATSEGCPRDDADGGP